jgi:CHAT domain-containing protein
MTDSLIWANIHYGKAYLLQDSGIYQLSEKEYLTANAIYKTQGNLDNQKRVHSNMGILYRFNKQFHKALDILTKGIALFSVKDSSAASLRSKAAFYVNRSEVYLETKQYEKAIADHDSAIYFFTLYQQKPTLIPVMLQARPVLLSVLSDKSKAVLALAEKNNDTEGYKKALTLFNSCVELANDIRADYFSEEAKLTLSNDLKPTLEAAIALCQKLYQKTNDEQYIQQAFEFMEFGRSLVLFENSKLTNKLPPKLKRENEALKKQEAALIAKNDVEALKKYLQAKRFFREKIKNLNTNQLWNIEDLKKELIPTNSTAFIEYFVGDSSIFVFTLSHNKLIMNELKKDKNFDARIENFRKSITLASPLKYANGFEQDAKALYGHLLQPIIQQLSPSVDKLIIAPDGILNYLPFEILVINSSSSDSVTRSHAVTNAASDFRKTDYLIKHYQISYAYSANLLMDQKNAFERGADEVFAGFASKYKDTDTLFAFADATRSALTRDGVYELKGAKEEVEAISKIVKGKAFLNESATEGVFKKEANKYRILHFAMHSLTDDKDPNQSRLLFSMTPNDTTQDNDLTAAELYATTLNAELAVLSACNTGYGTLNKGEGVMSLARAFTYAGVPATVTSLWKVPDRETREIMVDFYKNLKQGMTKDAALRQAKLTYLNNTPESVAANPFFWAGFVPMGNMESVNMFKSYTIFTLDGAKIGLIFLCILLSLLFVSWIRNREKLKHNGSL